MLRILLLALIAGCSTTKPCITSPVRPPTAAELARVEGRSVGGPADLDDATVLQKTSEFMKAIDTHDVPAFQALVGSGFALFEDQRAVDSEAFIKNMTQSAAKQNPTRTRTCKEEKIWKSGTAIIYVGLCTEEIPPTNQSAAESWEGWNTVVWAHHNDAWKVAHWGWQKGGVASEREMWNETFRRSKGFKQEPNAFLVTMARGRKPGVALDVAMGQGRNALYLASLGWKVTGVDISDEGIRKAKEAAAQRKLKLETVEMDIEKFEFGNARWDLVTLIYAGDDTKTIERIKPSIKKGGLFVVEYFHDDATRGTTMGGFADGELAKLFGEGWTILRDDVVEDTADWALGKSKLVRFAAQKK